VFAATIAQVGLARTAKSDARRRVTEKLAIFEAITLRVIIALTIAGAIRVSRGMLEFRADPESPYHDKKFRQGQNYYPLLRVWRALGFKRQGAQSDGLS
jgi:hypothetical protein